MAAAALYIVYINKMEDVSYADIKRKMDLARSWYRITESVWVLYTTSDAEKWYARLSPLVKDDGNLLICKLDTSDRQGWMREKFWNWMREHGGD